MLLIFHSWLSAFQCMSFLSLELLLVESHDFGGLLSPCGRVLHHYNKRNFPHLNLLSTHVKVHRTDAFSLLKCQCFPVQHVVPPPTHTAPEPWLRKALNVLNPTPLNEDISFGSGSSHKPSLSPARKFSVHHHWLHVYLLSFINLLLSFPQTIDHYLISSAEASAAPVSFSSCERTWWWLRDKLPGHSLCTLSLSC